MKSIYAWLDGIWVWIAKKVFVRFEFDLPKDVTATNRMIFALSSGGIIEWLILNSWCRSNGLGTVVFSNRLLILFLANPIYFFKVVTRRAKLSELFLSDEKGPRLLFTPTHERKKPFKPTKVEHFLCKLYLGQKEQKELPPIKIYPTFFLWRKHARSESRSLSEYLLGISSNPNWIGKLWYLLRKRKDSTVRALAPVSLEGKDGELPFETEEYEPLRIAKAVRRRILVNFHQEMRVVLGPRYLSSYAVKETLMRDPGIQKVISEIAEKEGVDRKRVAMRAYQNLTEIAANYRYRFVEVGYVVLNWIFTRVFDGMNYNEDGLKQMREVMRSRPVALIPSHRSHLDYLVLPYLMFTHDMATPHTVAGINLAFWPIGPFMRFGGAFFIRRSFRGDVLYQVCLKKYFQYLLSNKYNVMFFIEGTRSRSGKMLPPQYGILKMLMEAQEAKLFEDIAMFPVSIAYDEFPEERSYTKELAGGAKTKESASELIKTRKFIKKNIGRVHVQIAPPISTKEQVQAGEQAGLDSTLTLQKTAFQISKAINDSTPITPKALLCSTVLCHPGSSLPLDRLLSICEFLARYSEQAGMYLSHRVDEPAFRRTVEQSVKKLVKSGSFVLTTTTPRQYGAEWRRRNVLNLYKNGAIHCLVLPAVAHTAFFLTLQERGVVSPEAFQKAFQDKALEVRNWLKFDFYFSPSATFLEEIHKTMALLTEDPNWDKELIPSVIEKLEKPGKEIPFLFMRLLGDVWESYITGLEYFKSNPVAQADKKTFVQKITKFGEDQLAKEKLQFPESISSQSYTNALALYENLNFLKAAKDEGKSTLEYTGWNPAMEKLHNQFRSILELLTPRGNWTAEDFHQAPRNQTQVSSSETSLEGTEGD